MTNHLHIALSGSALIFTAGMIVKYRKIFCARDSDDGANCDRVLLYGGRDSSQGEVCRRWDVDHIASYLRKSKHTIDVCLTRLTNAELATALVDIKRNEKIRIKVFIHGPNTEGCQARLLRKHGIEVKKVTPAQKLQHSFVLMDAKWCADAGAQAPTPTALIGVLDSEAGDRDVYDSTLITTAPFVTTTLALEFQRLWAQFK